MMCPEWHPEWQKHIVIICVVIFIWAGCNPPSTSKASQLKTPPTESRQMTEEEKVRLAKAEELFCMVYDLRFQPEVDQAKEIPNIYRNILPSAGPKCSFPSVMVYYRHVKEGGKGREILTRMNFNSEILLSDVIAEVCLELLRKFPAETITEIEKDLANRKDNPKQSAFALGIAGKIRAVLLFDTVAQIFREGGELRNSAVYTLRDFRDIRAIDIILEGGNQALKEYFSVLRDLQTKRPPHEKILPYLSNSDPEIRWRAAYVLAGSGDPILESYAQKLMKDSNSEVRREGFDIALHLPEKGKISCRPAMILLLNDLDKIVKLRVATYFAVEKNIACGQALLELLQDESLGEWEHSNVANAMHNLTGSYFGYYHGSDAWQPTTENNKRAIVEFEKWLKEHSKK